MDPWPYRKGNPVKPRDFSESGSESSDTNEVPNHLLVFHFDPAHKNQHMQLYAQQHPFGGRGFMQVLFGAGGRPATIKGPDGAAGRTCRQKSESMGRVFT